MVGISDAYAADAGEQGAWDLTYLIDCREMCYRPSSAVVIDPLREVFFIAILSLPITIVDVIRLAVHSIHALSHHPVVDKWVGAIDATLETSNERISTL